MNDDREVALAGLAQVRELAHRLFHFSQAVPPSTEFCVGWTIGERLAVLIEDHGEPADLAWLIEIMGDCLAVLSATLREEHLAKSDGQ